MRGGGALFTESTVRSEVRLTAVPAKKVHESTVLLVFDVEEGGDGLV
jgi:hypothetical protein